jgi:predicted CxxxxCH...CXXCH cytochrome family protein
MIRAVSIALVLVACEKARPRPEADRCSTWEGEVRSLLEQRCSTCHSGNTPAGSWDVTTYQGTIGGGSDEAPNAIAFDPSSPMLVKIDPARADEIHAPVSDAFEPLSRWTIECGLGLRDSLIHAPGIQNPADPEFHGELLRSTHYDLALCARCHGDDYRGGASGASCIKCHEQGPTDCTTCHGNGIDAEHRAHADTISSESCGRCHVLPASFADAGHVLNEGVLDPFPAEVVFSGLAALDGSPSWDGARCSDVYCHGVAEPAWRAGQDEAACGTCHAIPPPTHASDRCESCHPRDGVHVDGLVQIGTSDEGCRGCHGEPESPAPLDQGAHRSHLMPELRLRGPIACSDCHLVPEQVGSAGHIDSDLPAEVFPPEIAETSLAFARDFEPSWDGQSCATYCHGDSTPSWDGGELACGSCHGAPPQDPSHQPEWGLTECAQCHPGAVDAYGNPLGEGHLDGNVDL